MESLFVIEKKNDWYSLAWNSFMCFSSISYAFFQLANGPLSSLLTQSAHSYPNIRVIGT